MFFRRANVGIVAATAGFEAAFTALDEAGLRALTAGLRRRLADGASPAALLPEALAAAREAGRRVLGERALDEQVLGAAAMARGALAEMKTGEGKTLAIAMAAYAWSLEGGGVHVLTANDYLASRDAQWMGPLYRALGTSCAVVTAETADPRAAYDADITYGTCPTMCAGHLQDRVQWERTDWLQQRGLRAAIVDEADLILVDQARYQSYRSIAESSDAETKLLRRLVQAVTRLDRARHLVVDGHRFMVTLTTEGERAVEDLLGIDDLYQGTDAAFQRRLDHALCAVFAYERDRDYVVVNGKASAVHRLTGRLDGLIRLPAGIAQAVEIKEGLKVTPGEIRVCGSSYRHFVKRYTRLAAATGTALEQRLYREAYGLEIERIPTHLPLRRIDHPLQLCPTERMRSGLAVKAIKRAFATGRPILVVADSIPQSEQFADRLREHGFTPEVLNPKNHEQEAEIISRAGRAGALTVVTRMAGRGVDIKLGGDDPAEHDAIVRAGGLYVLGLDWFENRRLEMHVRGRAGRRGDPGESAMMASCEDESVKAKIGKSAARMSGYDSPLSGRVLEHSVGRSLDRSTQRSERQLLHTFEIEDVDQRQFDELYAVRTAYFDGDRVRERVLGCCEALVDRQVRAVERGAQTVARLREQLEACYPIGVSAERLAAEGGDLRALLLDDITRAYERREAEVGEERMRRLERRVGMTLHDAAWRTHSAALEDVRNDVTLHTLTGSDWLTRYQLEAGRVLRETLRSLDQDIVRVVFTVDVDAIADL